jgi:hypothetical protein
MRATTVHLTPIVMWIIIVIHNVLLSFLFFSCYDFFSSLFLSILFFKIEIGDYLAL